MPGYPSEGVCWPNSRKLDLEYSCVLGLGHIWTDSAARGALQGLTWRRRNQYKQKTLASLCVGGDYGPLPWVSVAVGPTRLLQASTRFGVHKAPLCDLWMPRGSGASLCATCTRHMCHRRCAKKILHVGALLFTMTVVALAYCNATIPICINASTPSTKQWRWRT